MFFPSGFAVKPVVVDTPEITPTLAVSFKNKLTDNDLVKLSLA